MEPTALGVDPLLTSWLGRLPVGVREHKALLGDLFHALVPEGLRFVRKQLKETVATVNNNLVSEGWSTVLRLGLGAHWRGRRSEKQGGRQPVSPGLVMESATWAWCGTTLSLHAPINPSSASHCVT
jgi:hypothetical protein